MNPVIQLRIISDDQIFSEVNDSRINFVGAASVHLEEMNSRS